MGVRGLGGGWSSLSTLAARGCSEPISHRRARGGVEAAAVGGPLAASGEAARAAPEDLALLVVPIVLAIMMAVAVALSPLRPRFFVPAVELDSQLQCVA